MVRRVCIKPGMCGPNSLFVGQVGDWTWDAVSQFCGTNVYSAKNDLGSSTYLGFYYYHIKASPDLHLGNMTFGDLLDVDSNVFGFGSESVLTLHKITRASAAPLKVEALDLEAFYQPPDRGEMLIQNFNRWLVRTEGNSNENLQRSSPFDFVSSHLPTVPAEHSPRLAYDFARRSGSFLSPDEKAKLQMEKETRFEQQVDITRDLSIVDKAIWRMWQSLGWSDESFMARVVLEHQICFMGNADMGSTLTQDTQCWFSEPGPNQQRIFNIVIFEKTANRMMAVATVKIQG
jgi:probable biosynthetic protein (TIGR04098 family)